MVHLGKPWFNLDMETLEGGWQLAIGRFIDSYPDWLVCGTAGGYTAQRRGPHGGVSGPVLRGTSLDELGGRIEAGDRGTG
jgi:hypothetical protein